mgnify:CR=1 FL=1
MSNDISISVKYFYKNAVGESEYIYVIKEVCEALLNILQKEAHEQMLRGLRDNYRNRGFGIVPFLVTARCWESPKNLKCKSGIRGIWV